MRSKIIGARLPVLDIGLDADEKIVGVPDQLSWMSGDIAMTTSMAGGGAGGLFSRAVSGGGLFMTEFHAERGPGNVAFAAPRAQPLSADQAGLGVGSSPGR